MIKDLFFSYSSDVSSPVISASNFTIFASNFTISASVLLTTVFATSNAFFATAVSTVIAAYGGAKI